MLHINDLTYRIEGKVILDSATAAIPPGHKVGLVGRNGAGKTTLLRLLKGEISPDDGSITTPRNARIGHVAQEAPGGDDSLIDWVLTADTERTALLQEAETATDPHRIGEIQVRLTDIHAHSAPARAAQILSGLGFDEEAQRRPCRAFSGGWRMRVALGAILLLEPEILLLDEPTVGVDPQSRASIFDLLEELHQAGITILYTTHYMEEAERLCRTIAIVDHGKLLGLGSLTELVQLVKTPRFVRLILRSENESIPTLPGAELRRSGMRVDYIPHAQDGLSVLLAQLAEYHGAQRVEVVSPNLEMLFLELTGRELRDA